jgi:hypothetical protein
MARRLEKTPEFGGHPVGAASLPGCVRPVARPYLARGVPARPSRAFSWNSPDKVSEVVGGVASACSAIIMRRELDEDACANSVTDRRDGCFGAGSRPSHDPKRRDVTRRDADQSLTAGETAPKSRSERTNRGPAPKGHDDHGAGVRVGTVNVRQLTATAEIMDVTAGRDRQSIHEQRGRGFLGALVDRYRRGASVTAQCAPLSTSLLSATAAPPPAAVACGGRA